MTDRPGYSFNPGPPPEASRFLKNKGLRPAFSWQDVEPEEHAVAFTVAKAMQLDVLTTIREEVQRAIDDGLPFAAFQKNLRPRLEKLGWWGRVEMADPLTGEAREVQLGSPRRLRTIYNANLRSARAAGQWERIERTKKLLPFLEYRLGPSERHRPHHAIKEGLVLPVDDPFWDEWMPPNGWGCKCWVRQITRAEAERRGVDTAPRLLKRRVLNRRTGEMKEVPEGIDPGWERNPGKLRLQALEAVLNGKLEALPDEMARAALLDIATSWRVTRMATSPTAVGNVPIGLLPADLAAAVGASDRIVSFSDVTRVHVFEDKADRRRDDLAYMADLGRAARIVIQSKPGQQLRLIFELDTAIRPDDPDPYFRLPLRVYVVIKKTGSFLHSFHRTTDARWQKLKAQETSRVVKE